MKEMIYKQDALDAINRCRDDYDLSRQEQIDDCENAVRELPAVEERTGHWIEGKSCDYKCSACGGRWTTSRIEDMHYCPHCGAHMIKKDGETE